MINFVTLFAADLETTADVYRALGLTFVGERHGDGPFHLAHENSGDNSGLVVEIYQKAQANCDGVMLGLAVPDLASARAEILKTSARVVNNIEVVDGTARMIVADPEGRQIYVQEVKGT